MIREYLSSLEKNYGYIGNWQPDCPIQVGNWADVELGFLPWLKDCLGISNKHLEINKNLHSVMSGKLENIEVKKEKRTALTLSHNVSISMSESCGTVSIKAKKAGGFFAVFQDVHEINAEPVSFRDNLEKLHKTSVAVVSGVTYVKKGTLVIFNQETASIQLAGSSSSLAALLDNKIGINMDFDISYECAGLAMYQAESGKPLVPFLKLYIAEQDKQNGFRGQAARRGRNYDIMPFSYQDFFEAYHG
ncbi:MAG: hypothetical protein IJ567_03095 [Lachnospiraceae bacterium]|nr:hypothetical protein [Lachnospiraceae bacterium]